MIVYESGKGGGGGGGGGGGDGDISGASTAPVHGR